METNLWIDNEGFGHDTRNILICKYSFCCILQIINRYLYSSRIKDLFDHLIHLAPIQTIQTTTESWHGDVCHLVFNGMFFHHQQGRTQCFVCGFLKVTLFRHQIINESIAVFLILFVVNRQRRRIQYHQSTWGSFLGPDKFCTTKFLTEQNSDSFSHFGIGTYSKERKTY